MQKWQYLVVQVIIIRAFGKSTINIGSDDKEIEKALKGKTITDAFNYLGSLGWELTSTTPGSARGSSHLYFKRPYAFVIMPASVPANGSTPVNGAKRQ